MFSLPRRHCARRRPARRLCRVPQRPCGSGRWSRSVFAAELSRRNIAIGTARHVRALCGRSFRCRGRLGVRTVRSRAICRRGIGAMRRVRHGQVLGHADRSASRRSHRLLDAVWRPQSASVHWRSERRDTGSTPPFRQPSARRGRNPCRLFRSDRWCLRRQHPSRVPCVVCAGRRSLRCFLRLLRRPGQCQLR